MLVVAAIGYTYRERLMQSVANAQQAASHKPEPASGAAVLSNAPIAGEVKPAVANMPLPPQHGLPPVHPLKQSTATPSDSGGSPTQEEDEATKARREAWQAYYQQLAQLQKERLTAATSAMTADTALDKIKADRSPPQLPPRRQAGDANACRRCERSRRAFTSRDDVSGWLRLAHLSARAG